MLSTCRAVLPAFFLAVFSLPAHSETLEDCLGIEGALDRLACYDDVAGYPPETVADVSEEIDDTGDWSIRSETSKIDDSTNVVLSLRSETQTNCPYKDGAHTIVMACRENTTNLWVHFAGCHMADIQGGGRVTYRLDSTPAARRTFRASNDNSALGLWSGGQAIPFIKRMLGHERMIVRATPFSDSTVTGEYDISGLTEAITPLRDACNW